MPKVSELPEALRDLAYRNAAVLEDRRFASDVRALQDALAQFAETIASRRSVDSEAGRTAEAGGSRPPGPRPEPDPVRRERAPRRDVVPPRVPPGAWTLPAVLALSGTVLVAVWGVLVPRDWHSEQSGLRIGAALVLVAGAVAGLWSRDWRWVLAAGGAGLVGLALWLVQLLSTGHSVDDLLSPETDGIPNMITFAGALLVLVGGVMGTRAHAMRRG